MIYRRNHTLDIRLTKPELIDLKIMTINSDYDNMSQFVRNRISKKSIIIEEELIEIKNTMEKILKKIK